jgi:hypothetical protein
MKLLKFTALFTVICLLPIVAGGQTTKEEFSNNIKNAGGIYKVYTFEKSPVTPVPAGYKPFYISHYGRHGSRWLLNEKDYSNPFNTLDAALKDGKLTPLGKALYEKLAIIKEDARGRYGDLSPLGVKEHRQIAERMFNSFPEVFSTANGRKCFIYSRSTTVPRCIISMAANNERLKELNPAIEIKRDAAARFTYLNNVYGNTKKDTVAQISNGFVRDHFDFGRFLGTIFNDNKYIKENLPNPTGFVRELYLIATDLPDMEHLNLSIYDIFTKEDIFILWQATNLTMYNNCGPSPINGKVATDSSKQLLKDILDCADNAVKNGNISADLRFGHDSYIIPLLALMDIQGMNVSETDATKVFRTWCDFKASPMGANLQIIFYRNGQKGDVIVKFLHNEKEVSIPVKSDIAPYYHWKDVERYYRGKL